AVTGVKVDMGAARIIRIARNTVIYRTLRIKMVFKGVADTERKRGGRENRRSDLGDVRRNPKRAVDQILRKMQRIEFGIVVVEAAEDAECIVEKSLFVPRLVDFEGLRRRDVVGALRVADVVLRRFAEVSESVEKQRSSCGAAEFSDVGG